MCGLVVARSRRAVQDVIKMLDRVAHRGPDDAGMSAAGKWALGHARLAVLDVKSGQQPMLSPDGSTHIVYNGEIYNFRELGRSLPELRTRSDTEVIMKLHASGRDPSSWIQDLDGMFAFAIVDPKGLLLARDPLGIKPLYLGWKAENLFVASEIKALLPVADKIEEFPPGTYYTSEGGFRAYNTIDIPQEFEGDAEGAAAELRLLVERAVATRLISDVSLGVFLSGGLDSSIIAAVANKCTPGIKTFSVGIEGSADLAAARRVADFLGTDHYERTFTLDEAIRVLPKAIYHLESFDASLVRSAVPNYLLAELASQHVKVALSGEGADELFGGYDYLKHLPDEDLQAELELITRSLHKTNLLRCDRMSMAHGLEVRVPLLDDLRLVRFALSLPTAMKIHPYFGVEKWILRKAFESDLPSDIVWRPKEKFAQGAGIAARLAAWAQRTYTLPSAGRALAELLRFGIKDSEEYAYFRMFADNFPPRRVGLLIGRSRSR